MVRVLWCSDRDMTTEQVDHLRIDLMRFFFSGPSFEVITNNNLVDFPLNGANAALRIVKAAEAAGAHAIAGAFPAYVAVPLVGIKIRGGLVDIRGGIQTSSERRIAIPVYTPGGYWDHWEWW